VLDLLWYLALGSYTLLCIKEAKDTTDDLASINQADVTVTLVAYGVAAVLALMLRHIMFDLWRSRGDASAVFAPLACFHCIARVLTGYVCMRYIRRQPTWWLVWIVVYILVFFADNLERSHSTARIFINFYLVSLLTVNNPIYSCW